MRLLNVFASGLRPLASLHEKPAMPMLIGGTGLSIWSLTQKAVGFEREHASANIALVSQKLRMNCCFCLSASAENRCWTPTVMSNSSFSACANPWYINSAPSVPLQNDPTDKVAHLSHTSCFKLSSISWEKRENQNLNNLISLSSDNGNFSPRGLMH